MDYLLLKLINKIYRKRKSKKELEVKYENNITCRGCCWFGVAILRGIYKFGVLLSDRSTPRIYHGMGFPSRCNGTYPFFLFFFFGNILN